MELKDLVETQEETERELKEQIVAGKTALASREGEIFQRNLEFERLKKAHVEDQEKFKVLSYIYIYIIVYLEILCFNTDFRE